jgi:DNA-binding protein Fis
VRHPEKHVPAEESDDSATDMREFVDEHLTDEATNLYADALEFMERYVVTRVLRSCDGNQSQAARILGITRGCLRSKVRALNISIDARVRIEGEPVAV